MTDAQRDLAPRSPRGKDEIEDDVMDEVLAAYTDAIDEREDPHIPERAHRPERDNPRRPRRE